MILNLSQSMRLVILSAYDGRHFDKTKKGKRLWRQKKQKKKKKKIEGIKNKNRTIILARKKLNEL